MCVPQNSDLLVKDHVDSMSLDVNRMVAHELQDVLDAGGVRQPAEPHAVARAASRRQKGRRGEDWKRYDG